MKKEKISVIVSVYNTGKYIERCVDSLLKQTYPNLEIILINDGSKDKSLEILRQLEKENKNIKVIDNKKNKGLSYSRNIGLKNATGKYIGYIDSDDYVATTYYDNLMTALQKEKAEIAICDMKLIYESQNNREQIVPASNNGTSKLDFINNGLAASACNKLFKKEIIEKYPFAEGKVNEDIAVVIPALAEANKIAYVKDTYYNYVQRENSMQNSRFQMKRFDIFDGVEETLKRIENNKEYNEIKDALIYNQIITLLLYVIPKEKNIFYRRDIIKKYVKLSEKYNVRQNPYFWKFLDQQGKKYWIYYKTLFKLAYSHFYFLDSLAILGTDKIKKTVKKNIPASISMNKLIQLAKKQEKMISKKYTISVIIPNYNYEQFLEERLYSILYQKIKISEIIILDDCSKDNSRSKIDELVENLEPYINIQKVYNEKNSGSPFKQWQKGFNLATSDYVWIAEADDYSHKNFLKEIDKMIRKYENPQIAYTDTAFINREGSFINRTIKYDIDMLNTGHWDKSYNNDGKAEFQDYTYLNCTIANVSSCLIKKDNYDDIFDLAGNYRQSGDWLFYALVMQKGNIAYSNKVYNYYRVHGDNISSTTKKELYLKELNSIYDYYRKNYKLTSKQLKEQQNRVDLLKKNWNIK